MPVLPEACGPNGELAPPPIGIAGIPPPVMGAETGVCGSIPEGIPMGIPEGIPEGMPMGIPEGIPEAVGGKPPPIGIGRRRGICMVCGPWNPPNGPPKDMRALFKAPDSGLGIAISF